MIIGYNGACRREELINICVEDLQYNSDSIIVNIPKTKNNVPRMFAVTDVNCIELIKKYNNLRPKTVTHKRFFLTYRHGCLINSPIGINTMGNVPKQIASFLHLPDPHLYTGHCFRRSSATHIANTGGDILTIKRLGGWKSTAVAEGYVASSMKNKIDVGNMFAQENNVNLPGTSGNGSQFEYSNRSNITIAENDNFQQNVSTAHGITITSKDNSNVNINVYNSCTISKIN